MWLPQHYVHEGQRQDVPKAVLSAATHVLDQFYSRYPDTPALLSLSHLAHRAQVPYWRLRAAVERAPYTYRHFTIRKRSGGFRRISVPHPDVMTAQRWLTAHVLNRQAVHPASYAFRPGASITQCAARHTGARWLIKLDIAGFFDAISEIAVFRVFRSLGYEPLLSFELARLTTCTASSHLRYRYQEWKNYGRHSKIEQYKDARIGHLPQGAPTSPMLSNLVMREVDEKISSISSDAGLNFTRYSDDMTFSTRQCFDRRRAARIVNRVSTTLRPLGLWLNTKKTVIVPPGARKVVLGLLVDGDKPNLTRDFRDNLRQHLYYVKKYGPIEHMNRRGFETVFGMKNHIRGHVDFARMVDESFGTRMLALFDEVDWPL